MPQFVRVPQISIAKIQPFSLVIMLFILSTLVQLMAPDALELLRYQHKEVSEGEWWRIVSANFCHSNWYHWALNMTGLLLIDYMFQPLLTLRQRSLLMFFCLIGNVLLIHLLLKMYWYVGMSGALHGYLVGSALLTLSRSGWLSYAIILVVSGKLIAELNWEINSGTAELIGSNVAEEAHLYGALSAVAYFVIVLIMNQFKKQTKKKAP